ncbi:peptide chain release factor N(5)-glutamine methyltransferase [Maricaulis sp. W15]|uniref:peptide chain release factor N(5)-glutamine methyltransferase n=1 Tax=Maricaulis sp. W15 TaxID=1772333 RepID=UPI0009F8978E|nr:peptide chain release factor N(5)-glutamine methyltransferase [Maricaulis sp. W15]
MARGPFDTLVDAARFGFDAADHKPLLEAWQALSLADIRSDLAERLIAAGIDEGGDEARFLLNHVLAPASLAQALADPALFSWQQAERLAALSWRRLQRVPLSQVLGSQPFWTLDLAVTADVLTPRADTETLVEAVLSEAGVDAARLVDLGTGSGAILLALLSERPGWNGLGVDLSDSALIVASGNAERCGLANRARFLQGRWGAGLADASADILVSNPPYIVADVLAGLAPEVRDHEPALALDGGADGLDAYREIIRDLPRLLVPGGLFALEIGYDQGAAVSALAQASGLVGIAVKADLAGHDRVVIGRRSGGDR